MTDERQSDKNSAVKPTIVPMKPKGHDGTERVNDTAEWKYSYIRVAV